LVQLFVWGYELYSGRRPENKRRQVAALQKQAQAHFFTASDGLDELDGMDFFITIINELTYMVISVLSMST